MVGNIKILVEGNNDIQFLKSFIKINLGLSLTDANFHKIGGWSGLLNQTKQIQEFIEDDLRVILIINTDTPEKQGGFAVRKRFVEGFQSENSFDFPYYLLPNHQDNGALENLMYDCIPDSATFKTCWADYINCLSANENYHTPADKSMIMSYNELLTGDISFASNFENVAHFDLINNVNAVKLAAFLGNYFKK